MIKLKWFKYVYGAAKANLDGSGRPYHFRVPA